jgi:hypothetical protein
MATCCKVFEFVGEFGVNQGSKKHSLVVCQLVGRKMQRYATLGNGKSHTDEDYLFFLETDLSQIDVHYFFMPCQNLCKFN